ncbi:methyl-accepting chemotaxis protein [Salinibius halmophilus]|uniref:methyl-accepting chemotaxis protein n=1 Tax=Salinibius halmophilus TaxID=1853216 RepID=UPI000E6635FB|nr:methyl-accepting chemotaxis protein [Salinibius halmophilus]
MKLTSIKQAVVGIMASAVAILAITAIIAINSLSNDLNEYDEVVNIEIKAAQLADQMNIEFKRQVQEWKNVLIRGANTDQREKYWRQFQEQEQIIQSLGQQLLPLLASKPEFRRDAQAFLDSHDSMGVAYRRGFNDFTAANYNHTAGDKAVSGIDREPSARLDELANALTTSAAEHGQELQQTSAQLVRTAIASVVVISIVVVLLALWLISKFITRPLVATSSALRKIADGDLTDTPNGKGFGEIGQLNASTMLMHQRLCKLIADLQTSADELSKASSALSQNASIQANSANDQRQQTEQASTAVEELSSSAAAIASSANETSERTEQTNQTAITGDKQMQAVSNMMANLRQEIVDASSAVGELSVRVNRVDEVMNVINGIAEQTNLLALNAAIEAARAGEQGRGFAVVADEVRALAQKTQESTTEIADVLAGLRQESESTVSRMRSGETKTDEVVNQIANVSQRWQELANAINDIAALNTTVAAASNEQTTVTEEIAALVNALHNASQTLQTQASESAMSGKTLAELAVKLNQQVSAYRV